MYQGETSLYGLLSVTTGFCCDLIPILGTVLRALYQAQNEWKRDDIWVYNKNRMQYMNYV